MPSQSPEEQILEQQSSGPPPDLLRELLAAHKLPRFRVAKRPGEPEGCKTYLIEVAGKTFDIWIPKEDVIQLFGYEAVEPPREDEIRVALRRLLTPLVELCDRGNPVTLNPIQSQLEETLVLYATLRAGLEQSMQNKKTARELARTLIAQYVAQHFDRQAQTVYLDCIKNRDRTS